MTTSAADNVGPFSTESHRIIAEGVAAAEHFLEEKKLISRARDSQPERLAKARVEAEQARDWALIEEPFKSQFQTISSVDGQTMTLPDWVAAEVFGARLAADILDCGGDNDLHDDVAARYFSMVSSNPETFTVVTWFALTFIASGFVPMMLDEIETHASNYDARVFLAEARVKAWNTRVSTYQAEYHANHGHDDHGSDPWEPW